jgi:hypothetical protein
MLHRPPRFRNTNRNTQRLPSSSSPPRGQHWLWIAALIIVLFIGYTVGTNSHSGTTATPTATITPTRPVPTPTPTVPQTHYQIGQTLQIDGIWQVAIISVRSSSGDQYTKPKAGNTFVLIDVDMKNLTSQQLTASSIVQYALHDTSGQSYAQTPLSGTSSPDGIVQANAELKGTLVYEVPATIHTYTLSFITSVGRPQVIWDIQH